MLFRETNALTSSRNEWILTAEKSFSRSFWMQNYTSWLWNHKCAQTVVGSSVARVSSIKSLPVCVAAIHPSLWKMFCRNCHTADGQVCTEPHEYGKTTGKQCSESNAKQKHGIQGRLGRVCFVLNNTTEPRYMGVVLWPVRPHVTPWRFKGSPSNS